LNELDVPMCIHLSNNGWIAVDYDAGRSWPRGAAATIATAMVVAARPD